MKKNMLKKLMALTCAGAMSLSLAACGSANDAQSSGGSDDAAKDGIRIGVLQYATHPSLDNCYKGVLQGLEEAGYVDGENTGILQ